MKNSIARRRRNVLILGGRDNWIDAARALGVDLKLIQHDAMLTPRQRELGDRLSMVAQDDMAEIRRVAAAWHARERFDLILSSYEGWMEIAAELAHALDTQGLGCEAVRISRDKLLFRQHLAAHPDIPCVEYCECQSVAEVASFLRKLNAPIVVKPVLGTASAGVTVVHRPEEVERAVEWVATPASWMRSHAGSFMCERYLHGDEFSIDVMSNEGHHRTLAIAQKTVLGEHRISVGHVLPVRLDESAHSRIEAAVFGMLDIIGHRTGPTHTEFKMEQDLPRIIETQTRFGGSHVWDMIELTTGIHLPRHTLATFLGLAEPEVHSQYAAAAIRFLMPGRGTLRSVGSLETVRLLPGVHEVAMTALPGTRFGDICRFEDRHGYVVTGAADPIEAARLADRAIDTLKSQLTIDS